MKISFALLISIFTFTPFIFSQLPDFPRPCGIYTKGSAQPSHHLAGIRDYPFVDGHLLIMKWDQLELAEDNFDFSVIEQAIETLQNYNQEMSLLIFTSGMPEYILDNPNVEKYWNIGPSGDSTYNAVPWDSIATLRQSRFLDTLSTHPIFDSASQSYTQFKDHPVFKQIAVQVISVGGIRDPHGSIANITGYSRNKIANAFINTTQQYLTNFPNQFVYIGLLKMKDDINSPDLSSHLINELNNNFNSGPIPTLSYINEQLACSTPNPASALLAFQKDISGTMFQMLSSWRNPSIQHALRVDPCKTDSSGPDVGMLFGLENYNATYFEIWTPDLDWDGYNTLFQQWHDTLVTLCTEMVASSVDIRTLEHEVIIYPNPTNGIFQISGIPDEAIFEMTVLNQIGNRISTFMSSSSIDLSHQSNGIYFLQIRIGNEIFTKKIIKQ